MLPNFIGVGAQRAATTWLYQCLKEHPEVYVPEVKEIHFFDENYDKPLAWYLSFFEDASGYPAVGEITPNYLNVPEAIPRIAEHVPTARLIVILREPIARAYSAYRLLNERFGHMSFQEACESTEYFLRLSSYSEDLKRMYDSFPADQIRVFFYEDVSERPRELLRELFRFLEVDDTFQPAAATKVYNAIIMPGAQRFASSLRLDWFVGRVKSTRLGQWAKSQISKQQARMKALAGETRKGTQAESAFASEEYIRYLKDYFRRDILEVQRLTGRDLSSWL